VATAHEDDGGGWHVIQGDIPIRQGTPDLKIWTSVPYGETARDYWKLTKRTGGRIACTARALIRWRSSS
jgi:hypothetical protein